MILKKFCRTGTVHGGRFIEIFRNGFEQAHAEDHHVGIAKPGVDDEDHHLGQEGVGIPVRLDAKRRFQEQVDLTEVLVEQALEHQDGDERRDGIGQDQHDPVEAAPLEGLPLHQTGQHHADGQGEAHRTGGEDHGPDEDLQERCLDTRIGDDAGEVLPAHAHHETWRHALADKLALLVDVLIEAGVAVGQHQLAALVVTQQVAVFDHHPGLEHGTVQQTGVLLLLGGELAQAAQGQVGSAIRQHQIECAQVGAMVDDGPDGCHLVHGLPFQVLQLNNLHRFMDSALTDSQFTGLVAHQGNGLTDKGLVVLFQQQLKLIVLTTQEGEIEFTARHLVGFSDGNLAPARWRAG